MFAHPASKIEHPASFRQSPFPESERPLTKVALSQLTFSTKLPERVGIKEVIETINRMKTDGVIECYAIGGAVGATFYIEPAATLDVDIFVEFHTGPGSLIVTPGPIFDYLRKHGFSMQGQYVVIADWPVQFLPVGDPLGKEALAQAVQKDVDGIVTYVFTAEHIAAIALQTGRAKDKARVLQLTEAGALDLKKFSEIIARHDLTGRWQEFERQFLKET